MPERFELEYVGADNARHRPIMIHRALFGSVERFFGVLLEHYAGAFPTWLAPVQVRVLPVRDGHEALRRTRSSTGCRRRATASTSSTPTDALGKRIRAAKLEKMPYVLVVGDDDVDARHRRRQPTRRRGRARRRASTTSSSDSTADVAGSAARAVDDARASVGGLAQLTYVQSAAAPRRR